MEPLSLPELAHVIGAELVTASDVGDDVVVSDTATHSERIRSGAVFFALPGSQRDGHAFVGAAARNGALAAVVARGRVDELAGEGIPLLAVADPLRALQRLAVWWRGRIAAEVVAVAGSIGKTTVKDCLVHILSQTRSVYGTPGSYNSQLGVPLAVLGCPRDAEVAVIEVAVSDPGEMDHLAPIVRPEHLVLTNVGTRWRSRFTGRDQQIDELLRLAPAAPAEGWVLLGQDDDQLSAAAGSRSGHVVVQGQRDDVPRFAAPVHEPTASTFHVAFPDGTEAPVAVRTPSDALVADVQLAMSAAWLMGTDPPTIVEAVRDYTPTSMLAEIWRSPGGVTFVREMATSDPIAVSAAVRTARRLTGEGGRTAVVLSEPALPWEDGAETPLALALADEGVDDVYGVGAAYRRLAAAIGGLDLQGRSGARPEVRLFPSHEALHRHLVDDLGRGDVCVVQSRRDRRLGDLSQSLLEGLAPNRLYVDLSALEDNVTTFRRLVGPSVRMVAMVKALAYGTDAVNVGLCLQETGIDYLGVATIDEGVALRRAGIQLPILVVLGTAAELDKVVRNRLTPVVYSPEMLDAVTALAAERSAAGDAPVRVHVEVDTGMHRAGFAPSDVAAVLRRLAATAGLSVEGMMSHLACAEDPAQDAYTRMQLDRFQALVDEARRSFPDLICHVAATASTIRFPEAHHDMVRIGLGIHGLHPSDATAKELNLTPVIGLVSRIVQTIDVPPGERVGYGGTYTAPPQGARIGVVPAGYHDCVPRAFSNYGYVMVAGVRCPIVGTISMDSMTIDLSGCEEAVVGSDVLIYGRRGESLVPLEEVSGIIGTIPYEVMARVGPRVQRIFTRH